MHAHSCLRRHSIPHHQWRIQDFSEGVLQVRLNMERGVGGGGGGGGGGGALAPQIFALQVLKFLKSL